MAAERPADQGIVGDAKRGEHFNSHLRIARHRIAALRVDRIGRSTVPRQIKRQQAIILHERRSELAAEYFRRSRITVDQRSAEHTSELQSLMRISYAVFC